jgi:hypothetical protein
MPEIPDIIEPPPAQPQQPEPAHYSFDTHTYTVNADNTITEGDSAGNLVANLRASLTPINNINGRGPFRAGDPVEGIMNLLDAIHDKYAATLQNNRELSGLYNDCVSKISPETERLPPPLILRRNR